MLVANMLAGVDHAGWLRLYVRLVLDYRTLCTTLSIEVYEKKYVESRKHVSQKIFSLVIIGET